MNYTPRAYLGKCGFSTIVRRWPASFDAYSISASSASTSTSADAPSSLVYDRDTGIIYEASSSSTLHQQEKTPLYQTIIGIEIHAQLSIPTKLFSSAPTRHQNNLFNSNNNAPTLPNTNVHPYDLAYPGTLPASPSISAIKSSILASSALQCNIHRTSRFERKHYFYPDLPTGYQITQQRWPLASDGLVKFIPHHVVNNNNANQKIEGGKKKNRRSRGGRDISDDSNSQEQNQTNNVDLQSTTSPPAAVELRIERIQLEQDTGKTTTHSFTNSNDGTTITESYIDYNRAGCALIEIVSHPDLRSAHEAAGAVEHIRKLLKHVGSCDGRMEEGSLRCDLNVSIAPIEDGTNDGVISRGRGELPPKTGHRVEVKNLNSLRQIIAATEFEAIRQSKLAQSNTPTGRETRTFHVKPTSNTYPLGGETFCIRAKGDAIDYRFMPEPDLPPLILDEETLDNMSLEEYIDKYMPESAEEATARLVNDYGLNTDVASVITGDPSAIGLFEQTVKTARIEIQSMKKDEDGTAEISKIDMVLPKLAANWLCNDLFALIKKSAVKVGEGESDSIEEGALNHPISAEYSTVNGQRLGALIALVANETLTTSMAKKVLTIMFEEDLQSFPNDIAKKNGWQVISDMDTLVELCQSVVHDPKNASQLQQYKLGGKKIWKIEKYFIGKVMSASKGNAHPERMKEALDIVLTVESSSDSSS